MRRYAERAEQVTIDACVCQKPSCRVGAKSLNRGAGDQVRPSIDRWRRISGHRGSYGEITNREPLTWIGESFSGRLGLRELPAE